MGSFMVLGLPLTRAVFCYVLLARDYKSTLFDLMHFVGHWLITNFLPPTKNPDRKVPHPLQRTETIKCLATGSVTYPVTGA